MPPPEPRQPPDQQAPLSRWARVRRWLRLTFPRLYLTRCPWLLALVLVGIVPLSLWRLPTMFRSLFVLDESGLMWVALFATLASFTFLATRRTVLLYGPCRFGVPWPEAGNDISLTSLLGHLSTAVPIIATAVWLTSTETGVGWSAALTSAAKGVVGGFVAMLVVTLVYALLIDANRNLPQLVVPDNPLVQAAHQQQLPRRFRRDVAPTRQEHGPGNPVLAALKTLLGPGYFDDRGRVLPAHWFATALLAVFVGLYGWGYWSWQPGTSAGATTPALVYILVIATLTTWSLSGVAFYFDRHRLPTLLVVGVWCLGVWWVSRSDHYFALAPERDRAELLSPGAVAAARQHPLLVVVAADGGGIQASAWAATALTRIEERWPGFRHSVRLISAVSGGSVGTMFFVAGLTEADPRLETLAAMRTAAEEGSLNEAAWGLAYPDLWRVVAPSRSRFLKDRAWAMEQVWQRGLGAYGPQTLADLRSGIKEGWRPAVTFNATAVESGQRVAFATFAPPTDWRVDTLENLYGGRDIALTTAARLSATFPYVTAIARADTDGDEGPAATHFGDGGYYDNTAMVIAMRWLDAAMTEDVSAYKGQTVAFIRLRSFPLASELRKSQKPGTRDRQIVDRGWLYEIVGPIATLLSVRTTSQQERAEAELEFLQRLWNLQDVKIARFEFAFRCEAPLSWQLTPQERRRIEHQWDSDLNQLELTKLVDLARHAEASARQNSSRSPAN